MNDKHLNDFLELSDELEIKTGDLISEYTMIAINYSKNGFTPDSFDYDLAYNTIMEKYNVRRKWILRNKHKR